MRFPVAPHECQPRASGQDRGRGTPRRSLRSACFPVQPHLSTASTSRKVRQSPMSVILEGFGPSQRWAAGQPLYRITGGARAAPDPRWCWSRRTWGIDPPDKGPLSDLPGSPAQGFPDDQLARHKPLTNPIVFTQSATEPATWPRDDEVNRPH